MGRAGSWLVGAAGVLLLGTGLVVFAVANRGDPLDAGWSAYAPLEPGAYSSRLTLTFDGWAVLWTGGHLVGVALAVVGLLVLTGLGGWLLGRRAGRRGPAAR